MGEDKAKRLEAKGWKVGSVGDFLGQTANEEAFVELKLRLAGGLRERRLLRRLSQVQLARAVRSSQSRIAKMEAGDPSVSVIFVGHSSLTERRNPPSSGNGLACIAWSWIK